MSRLGFDIVPGQHPDRPDHAGRCGLAARFADLMLEKGVYVIGFSYPVVPKGQSQDSHTNLSGAFARRSSFRDQLLCGCET